MILLILLASLIIVLLCVMLVFFKIAFIREKNVDYMQKEPTDPRKKLYYGEMKKGVEWYYNQEKEDIYIKSHDGLNLHGQLIRANQDTNKIIILFHGYRSFARSDFSCAMPYYNSLGIDVLLVDQRSHGDSEGKIIGFGVKERFDVCSWVDYVKNRFDSTRKIYLGGMSMGASTVMMASNIVEGVSGIIADCGFTSPKEIIQIIAKKRFKLPKWCVSCVGVFTRVFAGFDYSYSAKEALSKSKIPVLFIHGDEDDFVPCYMTDENFDACSSPKCKIITKGAPHCYSILYEPERVKGAIEKFISSY